MCTVFLVADRKGLKLASWSRRYSRWTLSTAIVASCWISIFFPVHICVILEVQLPLRIDAKDLSIIAVYIFSTASKRLLSKAPYVTVELDALQRLSWVTVKE